MMALSIALKGTKAVSMAGGLRRPDG